MSLRDDLLALPTVEAVEIAKSAEYKGRDCYSYKITTLHPLNGKRYEHMWEIVKDRKITEAGIFILLKSYLNNWWRKTDRD